MRGSLVRIQGWEPKLSHRIYYLKEYYSKLATPYTVSGTVGLIAQLVEHLLCTQGVRGSNPLGSTTRKSDE